MKTNRKWRYAVAGAALALFLGLLILVRTVGVDAIGPTGTSVGLSRWNRAVRDAVGESQSAYAVSEVLGTLALVVMAAFAVCGVLQWIRRRSLKRVDAALIALGVLYVVLLAIYATFEVVVVNYRPILEVGATVPEASFPSSHTMLACVTFGSAAIYAKYRFARPRLRVCFGVGGTLLGVLTVLTRFLSGAHWFTDIVAGLLISTALLAAYAGVLSGMTLREKKDEV